MLSVHDTLGIPQSTFHENGARLGGKKQTELQRGRAGQMDTKLMVVGQEEPHPLAVTTSKPMRTRSARASRPLIVRRRWSTDPADLDRAATGLARLLASRPEPRGKEGASGG